MVALAGGAIAFNLTRKIHGSSDRNGLVFAHALAIFQCVTSVADTMSLSTTQ